MEECEIVKVIAFNSTNGIDPEIKMAESIAL